MKRVRLLKLKCNILLRKSFLNLILLKISPTSRLAVKVSQNLDKHIVLYQKELFIEYSLESGDVIC